MTQSFQPINSILQNEHHCGSILESSACCCNLTVDDALTTVQNINENRHENGHGYLEDFLVKQVGHTLFACTPHIISRDLRSYDSQNVTTFNVSASASITNNKEYGLIARCVQKNCINKQQISSKEFNVSSPGSWVTIVKLTIDNIVEIH